MKIRTILMKDNCLAANGERPIDCTDDGEWNKMDGNTIANLYLALADGVLSGVAEKKTAIRSVFMGNNHALKIASIDTIKIKMDYGTVRTIQQIRHVEGPKKNLLSLGQTDYLECKTYIENEILRIVRGALIVMKAEKTASNLYMLKGEKLSDKVILGISNQNRLLCDEPVFVDGNGDVGCLGYNRLGSNHCTYYKRFEDNDDFIILLLYMDDLLVVSPNKDRVQELKVQLAREFDMKDIGPTNKILGMQHVRFQVRWYLAKPGREHWINVEMVLSYIRGTSNAALCCGGSPPMA
ncbi:hypothetical protein EZV62_008225 [Acer yangbiense]|uniref:Uncharacterized protein n=1 Tax=Acer yangbiense TaxID=1000413 RepID=A0A5C7IC86_9ROSI|nr:hypothetical protein EZV62_008225 [Acer yangbiense]